MKDYLLRDVNINLFNPDNVYINIKNGIFNLQKEILLPHDPNYYSQFQLNISYDPKKECPLWKKSLKQWIPERETRLFLRSMPATV